MSVSGTVLERAAAWFVHSGIQEPNGGVARYYRSDSQRNAAVSTEITGYAISFLAFAFQSTGNDEFLESASRAADFLTRVAWQPHLNLFPFEPSVNGSQAPAYFFDSGIIVRGLLSLWRVTNESRLLEIAVAAGRGMLERFPSSIGIHPILELPQCAPLPHAPRWSASPGCYQLKSAMAWHDLFQATGDARFAAGYEAVLQTALENYRSFLPGETDRERVMDRLHAFLYFLEGMLPALDRPEVRAALECGIGITAGHLRSIAPSFARSDVYGQLLRIRLFGSGCVAVDSTAAAQEAEKASAFQFASSDPRYDGGFGFGTKSGQMLPFVNPVSTAFCAQALTLWQAVGNGSLATDRLALV